MSKPKRTFAIQVEGHEETYLLEVSEDPWSIVRKRVENAPPFHEFDFSGAHTCLLAFVVLELRDGKPARQRRYYPLRPEPYWSEWKGAYQTAQRWWRHPGRT